MERMGQRGMRGMEREVQFEWGVPAQAVPATVPVQAVPACPPRLVVACSAF